MGVVREENTVAVYVKSDHPARGPFDSEWKHAGDVVQFFDEEAARQIIGDGSRGFTEVSAEEGEKALAKPAKKDAEEKPAPKQASRK